MGEFGTDTTYLGDGVYAEWDGFSVWIYTDRHNGRHYICLEPNVIRDLFNFFRKRTGGIVRIPKENRDANRSD